MEINQIRYFLAICDKGSFTRAAQTCGIKQPSLTAAIQRLERSIGGKLFDRSSSPIRLTKLGSQLLPIWKEIDVLFEKTVALANAHFVQRETDHLGRVRGRPSRPRRSRSQQGPFPRVQVIRAFPGATPPAAR
jgi:DNA-binding transcriptional LysR family regulator